VEAAECAEAASRKVTNIVPFRCSPTGKVTVNCPLAAESGAKHAAHRSYGSLATRIRTIFVSFLLALRHRVAGSHEGMCLIGETKPGACTLCVK